VTTRKGEVKFQPDLASKTERNEKRHKGIVKSLKCTCSYC